MKSIENFISRLSLVPKGSNTTNLYFGDSREGQIRRNNLRIYLRKMKTLRPKLLILGEAPGYKGCRLSGIAFTSERILFENVFFNDDPIQFINDKENLESEMSATMVWNELSKCSDIMPLLWNIFPFHPHLENDTSTNRTPTKTELAEGKAVLEDLLEIYDIEKIIALGRKAESQLDKIGLPFTYIRHPANGGKNEFVKGLNQVLKY